MGSQPFGPGSFIKPPAAVNPNPVGSGIRQRMHWRKNQLLSQAGVAFAPLLSYEPTRIMWLLINLDAANNLFVNFDDSVSSTNGILVGPSGGFLSFNARDDGEMPTVPAFIIASGAATRLLIVEEISNDPIDFYAILTGING